MLSLADSQTLKFPILGVFLRHEKPLYCSMQIEMFVSIHLPLSFRQEVFDIDLSNLSDLVELNLAPYVFISLIFYPIYNRLLFLQTKSLFPRGL